MINGLHTIPTVPAYFVGAIKGILTPYHEFFMLTIPTPGTYLS